jgi:hypothetical protein
LLNDIWGRKTLPILNIAMECKPMACSLTLIKNEGVGILGWDKDEFIKMSSR